MDLDLVKSAFATLRLPPPSRLVLLEAATLQPAHVPPYPPDCPALLTGVASRQLAADLRSLLLAAYPEKHEVFLVNAKESTMKTQSREDTNNDGFVTSLAPPARAGVSLRDFVVHHDGRDQIYSETTCLYVPPLEVGASFESFTEIVAHLRAPDGCPWDREQTHASLRTHLLEETYETLAAIDAGDFGAMREEFGDMLLQVVLQTRIAAEAGQFTISEVIKNIYDKLVRRHPHVFGGAEVDGVEHVLQNWEKLKEQERGEKKEGKGLLGGVPAALPALSQAQEYQDRAARVGFDWPEIEGVLDKITEEIEEIRQAKDQEELAAEIGDLLFALVNLARWKKVDAESALRGTNTRFKHRFGHVEQGAKAQGKALSEMTLEEMDGLWEDGKNQAG